MRLGSSPCADAGIAESDAATEDPIRRSAAKARPGFRKVIVSFRSTRMFVRAPHAMPY